MIDLLKTKPRMGRHRKIIGSKELEQVLIGEDCLRRWAHLSLVKRCVRIKQLYGFDVAKSTLHQFYHRNGLGYKAAKAALYPHNKDLDELQRERMEFAMKLSDFILDANTEVIYIDETSFHR